MGSELKQKEQAEIESKNDVECLKQTVASLEEVLKCKQDECRDCEKQVSTAAIELKEHEKQMGTGDAHVESTKALLAAFEEIEDTYKFLKGPQVHVKADSEAFEKD